MNQSSNKSISEQSTKSIAGEVRTSFLVSIVMVVGLCFFVLSSGNFLAASTQKFAVAIFSLTTIITLSYFWVRLSKLSQKYALASEEHQTIYQILSGISDPAEDDEDGEDHASDGNITKSVFSLAYTDNLTGLGNRMRLKEKFQKLAADKRASGSGFAVGLLDLDGMKLINDLFGQNGGDEVLKQCALRFQASVSNEGFVTRCGGDEFAFIYPMVEDEAGAAEKGRMLQEVLQAPFDLDGRTVRLSGSFGFGIFPHVGDTFDQVMENIETALYHSKRGGRGRVTVFSQELETLMLENARMEQALRRAIANNEVSPHFQPIISLQDGRLLGFESLARWIDPDLGFVSPAKFIPLAEERGMISALTEKLLYQAAKAAVSWPEDLFLSFNLSSVQLVDPSTSKSIISVVERAGLDPRRLEIEVTETAMMSDPETAAMIVEDLHQAGMRISMDDFGTGQSSLGRLRELKLDKVKIDRAFIMAIGEDKPAEHIVKAILEMCAGLDLTVVAEGIEEIAQAESLKHYGCYAGQGYLFGKPQDERRTLGYIREFRNLSQVPEKIAVNQ